MLSSQWVSAPLLALVCAASPLGARAPDPPERPNILLIVADDLGWNDVGYHGAPILTPHIDRLAAGGVELDQHYVQPLCSPTRAALLTGRYPGRFGPHVLFPTNRRGLPPGTVTLATALRSLGYFTALSGKWHLGSRPEWGPNHYGFAESYGALPGAVDPVTHQYRRGPYAKGWHRNHELLDEEGNATELIARQALEWIRAERLPWCIYVPFTAVHIPIDAPDRYKELYAGKRFHDDPAKDESFKRYAAYVSQLDAKIGELITALEETGQRGRTLVLFTSDNGGLPSGGNPYIGDIPPAPVAGSNDPLRGRKGQLYEGGIRVPAFANWPGVLEPRKLTAPIHVADWMPTLSRLAGYKPEKDPHWDGRDIWPLLAGEVTDPAPRTVYWAFGKANAVRDGDWKLIARENGKVELYDLAKDPCEKVDVAEREPERVASLQKILKEARRLDLDELPPDLEGTPQ